MNHDSRRPNLGRRLLLAAAGTTTVIVAVTGPFQIWSVRAQQQAPAPEFDAVSVKPSDPNSKNGTVVSLTSGAGLRAVNATLKDLIETAYDVRQFQIQGGPGWSGVSKYDVNGTPNTHPDGAPGNRESRRGIDDVRLKVRAMLKDQFDLQLHQETRDGSIYSLVVAKGGIKPGALRATGNATRGINAGRGTMLGEAAPMTQVAQKLARLLERPVVDNTALQGNYDFSLEWTPDPGPSPPDAQSAESALGPSLFTALQQQLGLRLEASRGPVDVLVIDHAEKPADN